MRTSTITYPISLLLALAALGAAPSVADGQEIEVQAPDVLLGGVPFTLTLKAPRQLDTVRALVRYPDGRVIVDTILPPLDSLAIPKVVVRSADQLPLRVEIGTSVAEFSRRIVPAIFSILPPLIAIGLALVFHEVVTSLFVGVWIGCVFLAGYNPFKALLMTVEQYAAPTLGKSDHVAIVIFSLLLGGMVGLITRMGGARAIVQAVTPLATTPRRAQLATWLAGLAIFFDDYANTLIVGNTMRPLTDKLRVSREKLAYIVDSTAAPVAAIVFVSTWVGYEISLIGQGLGLAAGQSADPTLAGELAGASPFGVFIRTIPYLFYPILAIFTVALFAGSRRDFGAMLTAERRSASGGGLFRPGAQLAADMDSELGTAPEGTPLRWWNGVIPVVTVIVTVIVGLIWTGARALSDMDPAPSGFREVSRAILNNADPFSTLLWGSLLGCIVGIALATSQRILTLSQAMTAWLSGMRAMVLAMVILVLAWALSDVTGALSTGPFLASMLSDRLPLELLPFLVFVVAAVTAFATGTSWATMGILLPIIIPLGVALGGALDGGPSTAALLASIGSVLAGAIFGDHCSPISDTTVLSSMASGCDHVDHVRTQLPYAVLVAAVAGVALLLGGTLLKSVPGASFILLALAAVAIWLVVRFIGREAVGEGFRQEASGVSDAL